MSPEKRALKRIVRYVVVPALLVVLDTMRLSLESGELAINWTVVAVAGTTALLAGVSKWLRDEIQVDVKVV